MRKLQIQITAIRRMALSEIVKRMDHPLRLRNASNRSAIPIIAITLVLIDIIPKVDHIVHTLFAHRISISVEEPKRVVRTAVHSDINLAHEIVHSRHCFGSAEWTLIVAVADARSIGFAAGF
jgi:hypothetical protein